MSFRDYGDRLCLKVDYLIRRDKEKTRLLRTPSTLVINVSREREGGCKKREKRDIGEGPLKVDSALNVQDVISQETRRKRRRRDGKGEIMPDPFEQSC